MIESRGDRHGHAIRRTVAVRWLLSCSLLAACSSDPGPIVGLGAPAVSVPSLDWVTRIAWSGDTEELAFVSGTVDGDIQVFRASLRDGDASATEVGGFQGARELRYVPGGRDLIVVGRPMSQPTTTCGEAGVVVVHGAASTAVVGCPFEDPIGVLGRAGNVAIDPEQFVAVHPDGTSVVVPTDSGARWVDLSTWAERDLGAGLPVAFDPSGELVVVVELDQVDWDRQVWSTVTVADGERTALPVDPAWFDRGYHVMGVRWLAEGLILLIERDLADGSEWVWWNLDTDEERVLGPARDEHGAFPLGQVPRWSPSGRLLAFRAYECLRAGLLPGCAEPRWSIVVVDVETGERWLAYRDQAFVDVPAIAPDDRSVAFAVEGEIFVRGRP